MRKINQVIVHCTATRPAWMEGRPLAEKRAEIKRWHTDERGWQDIGYHWLIDRDGTYIEGRPEAHIGAHVAGRNADSIGIALIGGHGSNENDDASEHFTGPQLDALRAMLDRLKAQYPGATVHGHNEFAAKACPGFNVTAFLAQKRRENPAQSKTVQAEAAQIVTGLGGAATAVSMLDGTAQIILIGFAVVSIALAAFVMRERLKAWAAGWR
jgi:hypothetical protein